MTTQEYFPPGRAHGSLQVFALPYGGKVARKVAFHAEKEIQLIFQAQDLCNRTAWNPQISVYCNTPNNPRENIFQFYLGSARLSPLAP